MLTFQDAGLKTTLNYLKNFGFKNETEVVMPGTNAKMNEFQSLMGILVLRHIDGIIERSRRIDAVYRERLKDIPGIKFPPPLPANVSYNYGYEPVEIIEEEFGMSRDMLYEKLRGYNIYTRRYFYPLVCDYACYQSVSLRDPLPVSRRVSGRILTLPIYDGLDIKEMETICDIITEISGK